MVFLMSSERQISKFCWSKTQNLLLRAARFAAPSLARGRQQSTSSSYRIPKAFLIRDIPILLCNHALELKVFVQPCFSRGWGFGARGRRLSPLAPSLCSERFLGLSKLTKVNIRNLFFERFWRRKQFEFVAVCPAVCRCRRRCKLQFLRH
jgi:hypothetical protein